MKKEIHDMTSGEIETLIFKDAKHAGELVELPSDIADAIISHPSYKMFPNDLTDWAWETLAADI